MWVNSGLFTKICIKTEMTWYKICRTWRSG